MITLGPYTLENRLVLAPMVGVSDKPFRELCEDLGAGLTVGEMLTSNTELWDSEKNRLRRIPMETDAPRVVQIAGSDPVLMAIAAAINVDHGAAAIDINMGCPAKKVLKKAAGSALLKDPILVARILSSVVDAVNVPVTLKIRTGWNPENRNGIEIAKIAEDCGIQLLAVHGRTKECRFKGEAEYDTIAAIKQAVNIPIIANGDIDSPEKAAKVLNHTQADAIMIGRAAQGRPWIFKEIEHYLKQGSNMAEPSLKERLEIIHSHLEKLNNFYGETKGVWYARKHVSSYVKPLFNSKSFSKIFNQCPNSVSQHQQLDAYFASLSQVENQIESQTQNQEHDHSQGSMAA